MWITFTSVLYGEISRCSLGGARLGSAQPFMVHLQSSRITDFPWEWGAAGQSRHINYCSVKQRVSLVNDYIEESGGPAECWWRWHHCEVVFLCVWFQPHPSGGSYFPGCAPTLSWLNPSCRSYCSREDPSSFPLPEKEKNDRVLKSSCF